MSRVETGTGLLSGQPLPHVARSRVGVAPRSSQFFFAAAVGLTAAAALLAGWAPIGFSIATVFLFAGPHNWLEFRYFITRLPGRFGKLRPFFLLALAGTVGLTGAFIALVWLVETGRLVGEPAAVAFPLWDTALVLWILTLAHVRSQQNPRRDWGWLLPVGFLVIAIAWLVPAAWGLALVYLHPLMAFWLLDRELRRSHPEWRPAFHRALAVVPIFLGLIWWRLAGVPALPSDDDLSQQITQHAGADILTMFSSHLLVATHAFLEMLHYGVWVLAMPLVGLAAAPWGLEAVPLARRSIAWRRGLMAFLAAGIFLALVLWVGFVVDYPTTRVIYFTVAIAHILAEVPFLLRAL